jgi:AcrR family transcriptional regulator
MSSQAMKTIPKRKTREEILELSAPLFAQRGYDGVSMRDVARAAGLTQAALYYHFADKDLLYQEAVAVHFRERGAVLNELLAGGGTPLKRLERFVTGLARMMATDKDFLRLMQWVLLDNDEVRQSTLAKQVFRDMFVAVHDLASELDPHQDAHLLAMSIFGLVIFHFQTGATRKFMPGHRPHQDNPEVLARHVCELLRRSLAAADGEVQ